MKDTYQGSCHCGAVRFEVTLDPDESVVCDCSICSKKGGIINRVAEDQFKLLTPLEDLPVYQFNKRIAKHYFCPICGIYTFHRPRTAPEKWGVNVRCLEGIDLDAIKITQVHGSKLD
ncbi:MAG TPA: GFA family protein [Gammaproteobacteria bacterium]